MNNNQEFSYRILNESKKQFEITFKGKTLKFQLKIKRSFTVMKALLESYPDYLNIHDLDNILSDPNRAHSDLKSENGFSNFLIEKRDKKRVNNIKLDIEKIFQHWDHKRSDEFLKFSPAYYRSSLNKDQKNELYEKFKGKCNITGIKVHKKLKGNFFCSQLLTASYDHRIPVSRGGSNEFENWQLISVYMNREKNKICNSCTKISCNICALAFPEKYNVIQANSQDISLFKIRR